MKIPNKRGLQQIAINHSSDIDFINFIRLYYQVIHYDLEKILRFTIEMIVKDSHSTPSSGTFKQRKLDW